MLSPAIVLPSQAIINVHDLIANSPEISLFFFLPPFETFALCSSSHFNSITCILLLILSCPRVVVVMSSDVYVLLCSHAGGLKILFATNNKRCLLRTEEIPITISLFS